MAGSKYVCIGIFSNGSYNLPGSITFVELVYCQLPLGVVL